MESDIWMLLNRSSEGTGLIGKAAAEAIPMADFFKNSRLFISLTYSGKYGLFINIYKSVLLRSEAYIGGVVDSVGAVLLVDT